MFKYLILLIFILIGCGEAPKSIDTLINHFEIEASKRGISVDLKNIKVEVVEIKGNIAGLCYSNRRLIKIDRDKWEGFNNLGKEVLLFHELGHCVLGRTHKENSIMNSHITSKILQAVEQNKNAYNDELFSINNN